MGWTWLWLLHLCKPQGSLVSRERRQVEVRMRRPGHLSPHGTGPEERGGAIPWQGSQLQTQGSTPWGRQIPFPQAGWLTWGSLCWWHTWCGYRCSWTSHEQWYSLGHQTPVRGTMWERLPPLSPFSPAQGSPPIGEAARAHPSCCPIGVVSISLLSPHPVFIVSFYILITMANQTRKKSPKSRHGV